MYRKKDRGGYPDLISLRVCAASPYSCRPSPASSCWPRGYVRALPNTPPCLCFCPSSQLSGDGSTGDGGRQAQPSSAGLGSQQAAGQVRELSVGHGPGMFIRSGQDCFTSQQRMRKRGVMMVKRTMVTMTIRAGPCLG